MSELFQDSALLQEIDRFVEEQKDSIVRDIGRLVAIPSVQSEPEPGAPYGPGPRQALDCALGIAGELGSARCMNIVLFGAMTRALGMDEIDWEAAIRDTVPPKFLELNLKAYRAGYAAAGK